MQSIRRFRAQIILVIIALAAIALLLVAQGGGGESPSGPAPTSGGQYVEGLVGQPNRFNPLVDYANQVDRDVNRLIFSSLFKFDTYGGAIPDLVEAWGISATGDVMNITLRESIAWHDGEPLTTRDVLFTIGLMREDNSPVAADVRELWQRIEVTVFDERNMQFALGGGYAPFIDYLDFGVLPEHLLGGLNLADLLSDPFNLSPVGSGPYRFEELILAENRIDGVVLTANEDYYLEGPFIEQVVFRYFESTADALTAYRAETIMGIGQIEDSALLDVLSEPTLNVYTGRLPQLSLVVFNLADDSLPFFQESEVRRGLLMALNRPWIVTEVLNGQAIVADGPILPGSWAYVGESVSIGYDPEGAVDALRAEGWVIPAEGGAVREKDGFRMSFELVHPDTAQHTRLAEMIRDYWAAIGVQVELVAMDYDVLIADYLEPRAFEAALIDLDMTGSPDPDPYPFWHQSQAVVGQNYSGWDDRRASEYLEKARVSTFNSERLRLYRNFQVHFRREWPAALLFYPVYNYAVSNAVQGVSIGSVYDPADRFNNVNLWFLVATTGVVATEPVIELPSATP